MSSLAIIINITINFIKAIILLNFNFKVRNFSIIFNY